MKSALPPITPIHRTGRERFHTAGEDLGFDLRSFWRWSVSDLVSNATRGRLAEYLVARAIAKLAEEIEDVAGRLLSA